MNAEQALEYVQQVLLSPGPEDLDSDEFAKDWVAGATPMERNDILNAALDPAMYSVGQDGMAWEWIGTKTILDAWAAFNSKTLIEGCPRILNHPVGRIAALFALEAALRYDKGRITQVKEALLKLQPPLNETDAHALGSVLYHLDPEFNAALETSLGIDSSAV